MGQSDRWRPNHRTHVNKYGGRHTRPIRSSEGAREMSPGDGTAAHQPIRRSGRIVRRIAILLSGHDEKGNTFTERTHTVMLSVHGAGMLSTHRFAPEQQLILRVEETNREAVVRVVGEIATEGELHTYGVAFLNERLDFWRTEFPPALASDARLMALPLECGGTGARRGSGGTRADSGTDGARRRVSGRGGSRASTGPDGRAEASRAGESELLRLCENGAIWAGHRDMP